jgi:hypothetical protein
MESLYCTYCVISASTNLLTVFKLSLVTPLNNQRKLTVSLQVQEVLEEVAVEVLEERSQWDVLDKTIYKVSPF